MAPLSKKSGRGKNWTTSEVTRMLTAVDRALPLGMNEWDAVERYINSDVPRAFSFRDWEVIKRKFFLLKNTLKPTGHPTCPPEVALAKRLYRQIVNRAGVEDFGGDENDGDALVRDVSSAPVEDMEGTPSAETPEPTTAAATGKRAAAVISQVAKRRKAIDDLLDRLGDAEGSGNDSLAALVVTMEETLPPETTRSAASARSMRLDARSL
ncbi:hypothetical protein PF005_g8792 [Phytophthora fragariae]|uniref:DUF6818 domain-containing protein n=1 Tax=Phytophthora fragariae TaxID=53985 RepID=A0A6A3U4S4_9STRA|nr:hypothetical protein PF003_g12121 [Phytophthora fragariae]KAE8940423.1 hypothetical protein PF009_g9767 [Phytophthora fragariae]KAE9013167.1 hypothetical protein PF011_g8590 [Phytophthora fragariae]KAE9103055.1 hypothetical protein PF007_g14534 [Phytophthora fragariae]KAE9146179.1 hypothetical protein PF006_g9033 [Phytophthora fragariae]